MGYKSLNKLRGNSYVRLPLDAIIYRTVKKGAGAHGVINIEIIIPRNISQKAGIDYGNMKVDLLYDSEKKNIKHTTIKKC